MVNREKLGQSLSYPVEQFTREIGSCQMILKMEEESKFGLMVLVMMGSGEAIWQTDMAALFMPKGMFMKESGQMTKLTDLEFTHISMEVGTKDNGTKTNNTGMV